MRGPNDADRKVAFDNTILGSLIEIISRGPVSAGIDDVADEIAPQHEVFARETVNTAPIVKLQHRPVDEIVLDPVSLTAAVDSGIGTIVDLIVADKTVPAARRLESELH